jgi:hypothetical protein
MREINNNTEIGKVQDIRFSGAEKADKKPEIVNAPASEIKDFSNPKAELSGRVQVSSADNLKNDVAFGMVHPEAMASSDRFFEMKYNELQAQGHPNAYEEAAAQATAYGKEFC